MLSLLADTIRKVFTEVRFSEKGTNDREHEERAFMYFVNYLEDCESGVSSLCAIG